MSASAVGSASFAGFTLVEALIVMGAMLPIVFALGSFMIPLAQQASASQVKLRSYRDVASAQDAISRDIAVAKSFLLATDSGMSDPYGPDNAGTTWNSNPSGDGTTSTLILRMYATTASESNSTRQLVYRNVYGCGAGVLETNPPVTVNVIYFVRSASLYRRILTDGSLTTCASPYQQQTCPADVSRPWNPLCKDADQVLATGVSSFSAGFYVTNGGTGGTPLAATTQQQLDVAEAVDVDLTLTRQNGTVSYHDGRVTYRENT